MKSITVSNSIDGFKAARILLSVLATIAIPQDLSAQFVPPMINYQGRVLNSNGVPLVTGDYDLKFSIYDAATNGTQIWGPQIFDGQAGAGHGAKVPVVQGWFNVLLGPMDTNGAPLVGAFRSEEHTSE